MKPYKKDFCKGFIPFVEFLIKLKGNKLERFMIHYSIGAEGLSCKQVKRILIYAAKHSVMDTRKLIDTAHPKCRKQINERG